MSSAGPPAVQPSLTCKILPIKPFAQTAEHFHVQSGVRISMSEKPYQKPVHGELIPLKGPQPLDVAGPGSIDWVGTDLARFAQDVIALNRQLVSTIEEPSEARRCHVASLESLQRGLRIKKKAVEQEIPGASVEQLSRFRKE